MSLWLDKHRPTNLDKLNLHEPLNARLRKVANSPQVFWRAPRQPPAGAPPPAHPPPPPPPPPPRPPGERAGGGKRGLLVV